MFRPIEELNRLSLSNCIRLFKSLSLPTPENYCGIYKGYFVGPAWLRGLAGPLLVITRMGDWRGKEFDLHGNALNLIQRKGVIEKRFPMLLEESLSLIDRQPALVLRYASTNPFPWPRIVDELRLWQPGMLLGMSIAVFGPFRRLPLPFLLQAREDLDGL